MKTRITELLNIKYPVIQGGMAWCSDAALASAVSNAGGLGIITSIYGGPEAVREEIRKCKQLTDKPFGVNLMLQDPNAEAVAKIVIEEQVPVVSTGAGSPAKYMGSWLEAGIKVLAVVASPALAIRMERMGASAIVAEGAESGGHIGEMNTMALIPQICDAVSIPVIAAGGIADGRGLAAAFMLGAEGVQCGTCFLVAEECSIHQNYKEKVVKAAGTDTAVTGKTFGHPVRAIKSPFTRQFAEMEKNPNTTAEEIMAFGAGSLRKAAREGNENEGSFMAGQSAGLANSIRPAKEIIESMVEQAAATMASRKH